MTDSAQLANINRLLKKAENEPHKLTDEEKGIIYGTGNANTVRYARRGDYYVSRTFAPNEEFDPGEWVDSPTKLGAPPSHPGAVVTSGSPGGETVVGYIGEPKDSQAPPAADQPAPTPTLSAEDLAAVSRPSASPITSSPESNFGDVDDPRDAGPGTEIGRPLRHAGNRR